MLKAHQALPLLGRKDQPLIRFKRAAEFSADPVLRDPIKVVRFLLRFPKLIRPFADLMDSLQPVYGRPRLPGNWPLLYMAFLLHRVPDIAHFHHANASSELWSLCGFTEGVPHPNTTYNRFVELEQYADVFEAVLKLVLERARKKDPAIGRHLITDMTGFRTNARMYHVCPDKKICRHRLEEEGKTSIAKLVSRAPADDIAEERHNEAELPIDELFDADSATRHREPTAQDLENAKLLRRQKRADKRKYGARANHFKYKWLGQDGTKHLFRWRDNTAGARMYSSGRQQAWVGGYNGKMLDARYGMPVSTHIQAADVPEYHGYPDMLESAIDILGGRPVAIGSDRGFAFEEIYRYNTQRGIGSSFPWREPKAGLGREHYETDEYDRYGRPTCRHCGGAGNTEGSGLGFAIDGRGQPVIRFRCAYTLSDDCRNKVQTQSCKADWRVLGPITPRDDIYQVLKPNSRNREHYHRHARSRYTCAGMNYDTIPKRCGLATQRLRAAAGMVLDWFRLSLRMGWIGSHKSRGLHRIQAVETDPSSKLAAVDTVTRREGLNLPRGKAAERLGLVWPGAPPTKPAI